MIYYPDLDGALLGVTRRCGGEPLACYDYNLLIREVMKRDDVDEETDLDYVEFNICGAYMGPHTPLILYSCEPDDVRVILEEECEMCPEDPHWEEYVKEEHKT